MLKKFFLIAGLTLCVLTAYAKPLKVGVVVRQPLASYQHGHYKGIAIEVWQALAQSRNWQFTYLETPFHKVRDAIEAMKTNKIDVVIGAVSLDRQQSLQVAYSSPYLISPYVLVASSHPVSLSEHILTFFLSVSWGMIAAFIVFFFIIIKLVWLLERQSYPDKNYHKGMLDSLWHVFCTFMMQDPAQPLRSTRRATRLLTGLLTLLSVFCLSAITASLASKLTVVKTKEQERLRSELTEHFAGKSVYVTSLAGESKAKLMHMQPIYISDEANGIQKALMDTDIMLLEPKIYLEGDGFYRTHRSELIWSKQHVGYQQFLFAVSPQKSHLVGGINHSLKRMLQSGRTMGICFRYLRKEAVYMCSL